MKMRKSLFLSVLILFSAFSLAILSGGCSNDFNKTSGAIVVVDRGQVVNTVVASGVVEAENEAIILSPYSCIIKKIDKNPGTQVKQGEIIVELDTDPIKKEIEDIKDQLEVKKNTLEKTRLNNRSSVIDQDYNTEVKQLKITSLKSQLIDEEQLLSVGGISPARLEETRQSITLAERDLEMTTIKNEIRLKQLHADEEGLLLQIKIQEKQLAERINLLDKMEVKAPSDGILISISGKVGEKTSPDRVLVRMSDLSSFIIKGSVDEKNSASITVGNQVYVIFDNESIEGTIQSISPMVENSKMQFIAAIENGGKAKLIANQAVSLNVVQTSKNNSLRIPSSVYFYPNREQVVLVKDSGKVTKKSVRFGIKGTDFQEIVSGLNEGDQVVLSGRLTKRTTNNSEPKN
jgi:HlyD family secretion protein